jgi:putative peptidoglycan lipid II flippase
MSKVAKATMGLMLATMIAKVLGFGRELVLASSYGTSMYSDAYLTAVNIPLVIFAILGSTLNAVFIPMYFNVNERLGEKSALKFTNNIFNIVVAISIILAILGMTFTEPLVKVFAMGFVGKTLEVTIEFTRVMMLGVVFTGLSYVMTSYLQIKNNFAIPGLISVPRNIITIASIILSVKYGPNVMIWGTLLGVLSEYLFQLPFALKNGYKHQRYINFKDESIKKLIILIGPVLIGVAVNQVNMTVDRTLASTLTEGSISALNYANKLNSFIMALFITSISIVIYPKLSKLYSEKNMDEFIEPVYKCINAVILLILPITVGAVVLATPIVKILFERGAFDSRATKMTAIALIMYSIGIIGIGLRDILGKVFYSLQDTRTPMINGIIAMSMNMILNIILIKHMKIAGIAFSTSLSSIVCVLLLFRSLKKKIGYYGQDKILSTTFKSSIAALVMGVVVYFTYNFLNGMPDVGFVNEVISLFGTIGIGAVVYSIMIIILKVEEINMIKDILKSKSKK